MAVASLAVGAAVGFFFVGSVDAALPAIAAALLATALGVLAADTRRGRLGVATGLLLGPVVAAALAATKDEVVPEQVTIAGATLFFLVATWLMPGRKSFLLLTFTQVGALFLAVAPVLDGAELGPAVIIASLSTVGVLALWLTPAGDVVRAPEVNLSSGATSASALASGIGDVADVADVAVSAEDGDDGFSMPNVTIGGVSLTKIVVALLLVVAAIVGVVQVIRFSRAEVEAGDKTLGVLRGER